MAFEVRAAHDGDRAEVLALVREMIPGVDAETRLRWMYEANPGGHALTWIASDGGEVAGCTSYFPFRLQLDGTPILAALGGDGYVRPTFRRRGLGALLHEAARSAMPAHGIAGMYGAPGEMNLTPLKHGGSRETGQVARWVRPLRGAALGVRTSVLDRAVRGVLRPRFTAFLDPATRGDVRIDDVWRAAAPHLPLAAIRDARFYTWRFVDAPSQRQPAFIVVQRGRAVAACALEQLSDGRTLRIVDLVAVPGAWHTALRAIVRHAADSDAHIVDIKLHAFDGRARHMWRSGFVERDRKPFLVVIPPGGDRRLLDPMRWFYGGGDSDVDVQD